MGFLNRYLLLLVFNVLNIVAFGAIVSVAVINIVDHNAPTNLIIYYAYTGLLSLGLLFSEISVPRLLNAQARFLFTYTGRGILLTYFACVVYTNSLYNVIACIFTVSLGVVYFVVAWVPFVPLHNGLVCNFSRWRSEGNRQLHHSSASMPYSSYHIENNGVAVDSALGYAQTEKLNHTLLPIVPPISTTATATATAGDSDDASAHPRQDTTTDTLMDGSSRPQHPPYHGAVRYHNWMMPQAHSTTPPLSADQASHYSKHVPARSINWSDHQQQHNFPAGFQRSSTLADPDPDLVPSSPKHNTSSPPTAATSRFSNESFIYGLTNEPKVPDSTGDDYLDSIINSSCFAREVLDPNDDNSIVVRDTESPSRSYGLAANVVGGGGSDHGHGSPPRASNGGGRSVTSLGTSMATTANTNEPPTVRPFTSAALSPPRHADGRIVERISPPIPYRMFAPETQAAFVQNMAHVSSALSEDYTHHQTAYRGSGTRRDN
ncbi:hypothetical protein LPJ72_004681 [Coemansia sp. Benny D160-2]|nr:hypothetical protein LPJ72_004681 [Coemansia sp. Benny D160-2]